jgi:hypothetical protein
MALDWSKCAAVESVPGRVSGAWVFRGTRLPVAAKQETREKDAPSAGKTSRRNPADLGRACFWRQIRCVEGRRSVGCTSHRSKSEIPATNAGETASFATLTQ